MRLLNLSEVKNVTIPNHTKPYQTIPNHTKPYQTIPNHSKPYQTRVPIASRSDLTEGGQSRCNWHPANSSFGLLKDRQPKGTCLKGNLSFGANKVWGKNFEHHLAKVWGVVLKIFSLHFICPKA